MEELESVVEERSSVYDIKHRAFYFSKDIILFVRNQKMTSCISACLIN